MKTKASKDSQDSHVPAGATPAPADKALARSADRYVGCHGRSAPALRLAYRTGRRFASCQPARTACQHTARASLPKVVSVGRNCGRARGWPVTS